LIEEEDSGEHGGERCTRRCLRGKCCYSSHNECLFLVVVYM
jgi:hypothetical protein